MISSITTPSILEVIVHLNIIPNCPNIPRNHLLDQTQQNSLRIRILDLNFERLCKMGSIHRQVSTDLLPKDVEGMLELETFEELLDQVHT